VEELSILLGEAVETEARVIAPFDPGNAACPPSYFEERSCVAALGTSFGSLR